MKQLIDEFIKNKSFYGGQHPVCIAKNKAKQELYDRIVKHSDVCDEAYAYLLKINNIDMANTSLEDLFYKAKIFGLVNSIKVVFE